MSKTIFTKKCYPFAIVATSCALLLFFTSDTSHWIVGQGVNGEGFNFKLGMVKMYSTWPLMNKYTLSKKIWSGSSDPTVSSDPLTWPMGKAKNWKSEFCSCHGQNVSTVTWKELLYRLNKNWIWSADPMVTFKVLNGCFGQKWQFLSHLAAVGT